MEQPVLPRRTSEMTPEWMEAVFTDASIPGASVTEVHVEPVSVGGFAGRTLRLRIEYDGDRGERPETIVLKTPTPDPGMRSVMMGIRGYELEALFYERLAADVPVATARTYWSGADFETGDFCLLVEDLIGYAVRKQTAESVDEDLITGLVRTAAKIHARWWNDPSLAEHEWLSSAAGPEVRTMHEITSSGAQNWYDEFAGDYPSLAGDVIEAYTRMPELAALAADGAETLVHGDYRLENAMVTEEPDRPPLVLIDWQLVRRGSGAQDLAYLLSQSIPIDQRRANQDRWFNEYLTTLDQPDYTEERFRRDYAIGLIHSMQVPLLHGYTGALGKVAIEQMPPGDRRTRSEAILAAGTALIKAASDRAIAAIEDYDALSLIA